MEEHNMVYDNNGEVINESLFKSKLDTDFKSKEPRSLSEFDRYTVQEAAKMENKTIHKFLSAITLGIYDFCRPRIIQLTAIMDDVDDDFTGCAYYDGKNLVCVLVIVKTNFGICIDYLEISKNYRGCGLAKQLLDVAINEYKGEYLCVDTDNLVARRIYEKYGFEVIDDYSSNCLYMRLKSKSEKISLEKCTEIHVEDTDKLFDKYTTSLVDLTISGSESSDYYLYQLSGKDQLIIEISKNKRFDVYLINRCADVSIIGDAIKRAIELGGRTTTIGKNPEKLFYNIYIKSGLRLVKTGMFKYFFEV